MADEKVSIVVELVDKASAGLKDIKSSMTDWDAAVDSSKKFAAGLAVVATALAGVAAFSISQAQEAVRGQKELAAVLLSTNGAAGMTVESVNALATELSRATNFTDDAVLSAENMLLTFTNIGADVFPAATEATLNMAEKFGSVEAASVQLGKALNDPIAGVTALRKVGVMLTAAQEESIAKFMEMGDLASAQKVILDELGTEFGDLARSVADPLTQAKNQFGEIAETLGMVLLPYVNQAATAFLTWMDSMGGAEGIIAKLQAAFVAVEPYFPIIAGAIMGALVPALYTAALALWAFIAPLLIPMAIGAAIALAIMGIKYAIDHMGEAVEWVKTKIDVAWNAISTVTNTVFTAIAAYISEVWNNIKTAVETIANALWTAVTFIFSVGLGILVSILEFFGVDWEAIWTSIKVAAELIWYAIQLTFTTVMNAISATWSTIWNAVKAVGIVIWDAIKGAASAFWDAIVGFFNNGSALVSSAWSTMWTSVSGVAIAAWDAVKSTVASSINWIIDKINYLIAKANALSSKVGGPTLDLIPALTFAQGGTVPSMVDWSHQGGDTVPALLTPGERVLTPAQSREYDGGGAPSIVINVNDPHIFDTDDIVTKIGDPIMQVFKQHFAV